MRSSCIDSTVQQTTRRIGGRNRCAEYAKYDKYVPLFSNIHYWYSRHSGKHHIQPGCGEWTGWRGTDSRTKLRRANSLAKTEGKFCCTRSSDHGKDWQLNPRLTPTLLKVITTLHIPHAYIKVRMRLLPATKRFRFLKWNLGNVGGHCTHTRQDLLLPYCFFCCSGLFLVVADEPPTKLWKRWVINSSHLVPATYDAVHLIHKKSVKRKPVRGLRCVSSVSNS